MSDEEAAVERAMRRVERPIEELRAGDAFRETMLGKADADVFGTAPLWHGWVIMDAFLAGIDWARAQEAQKRKD